MCYVFVQIGDASGKAKEALEATRANLEKTAEDLSKAHPEVQAQAGSLKDKIQAAVENAVQVATKLLPSTVLYTRTRTPHTLVTPHNREDQPMGRLFNKQLNNE